MAYLHKKFKKFASSEQTASDSSSPQTNVSSSGSADTHQGVQSEPELKHSVGNMVGAPSRVSVGEVVRHPSDVEPSDPSKRNVCPYCQLVCTKPSVLEKHIRTHTNERPYPCESCGFSFKTKSNLFKHFKSRTHSLKVEKGIESSSAEIIAELGDSGKDELDIINPVILQTDHHRPDLHTFNVFPGDPNLVQGQIPDAFRFRIAM